MKPFPHFAVIGAQKSGTTSLCAFLESVDGVSLSRPKEPMFFSRDEIALHPHFFAEQQAQWFRFDWDNKREALLAEYASFFSHAAEGDVCGEGSTSYLPSQRAPQRIASINPEAKIIVVLRDPAARAYSAYWHYVKQGIACEPFERHLQYESGHTVASGEYVADIERWLTFFPRTQCHFMLYEALLSDPATQLQSLCGFLGITCPESATLPKENAGKTPRLLWLQLLLNRLNRMAGTKRGAIETQRTQGWLQQALSPVEQWNLVHAPYPAMPHAIHHALDVHYARANASLASLTGLDVSSRWYQTLRA